MIKKPEDNIDASHTCRLSIDNFTIIKKFNDKSSFPEGPGRGEIHSNGHNLPWHCTTCSTESPPVTINHYVNNDIIRTPYRFIPCSL